MPHLEPELIALIALGEPADADARAHLDGCPACAAELESLAATVVRGRAAGPELAELVEPPERVWDAIAAELDLPADVRPGAPAPGRAAGRPGAVGTAPPARLRARVARRGGRRRHRGRRAGRGLVGRAHPRPDGRGAGGPGRAAGLARRVGHRRGRADRGRHARARRHPQRRRDGLRVPRGLAHRHRGVPADQPGDAARRPRGVPAARRPGPGRLPRRRHLRGAVRREPGPLRGQHRAGRAPA